MPNNQKSPTIAIIRAQSNEGENHTGIDPKKWDTDNLSHYKLKDEIEEFVQFISVKTIYELFEIINVVIAPSDKHIVNIEDLYYTSDYVYQAIFKCVAKDVNDSYITLVENSNKLATQMLGEKHAVDGNMILIKRSIYNNDFEYSNISFEDITDILKSQFLHTAVIVKSDNTIEEASYIYSPLEIHFGQTHIDNVRYHEFKFIDYRLFFHVDTKAEKNQLNRIASAIYGKKIYGNVLISLSDNSDSSPLNLNMTQELITQIYSISVYHKINNTEINRKQYARKIELENKDIEDYNPAIHTEFNHNNFPEITLSPNFFQIIKLEYIKINNNYENIQVDDFIDKDIINDIP
jgi:hypothetical protein